MRRTLDQALAALERQIQTWATGGEPEIRVFVYPPEWEAIMLLRVRELTERLGREGLAVEVENVGRGFLSTVERRAPLVERLAEREARDQRQVVHDLGVLASRYLDELFRRRLAAGTVCRLVVNTGALATIVSYSAIMNGLYGARSGGTGGPTIVAFPGEADDRSLSLLGLRKDTNYRTARI